MDFLKHFNTRRTPQNQPIPGSAQVPNSAGGYSFEVDDWMRLNRFLVLGTEGGSYYATEHKLTVENAEAVRRCIAEDGPRVVETIVAISEAGRAPKNDPALFALAMAAGLGDAPTRKAALAALPRAARTGTHLLHFAQYVEGFRGWGRGLRQGIAAWYNAMPADRLAYQLVKYQQRDGWSQRDLLRLSHPQAPTEAHNALYHWVTQSWPGVGDEPHPDAALRLVWAHERAKRASNVQEIVALIRDYRLPRESIPTEWLKERTVWEALLAEMPMTAMIRNLATMTRVGLLEAGSAAANTVLAALRDEARLRRARIHPIAVLAALLTYQQGRGVRGTETWTPITSIVDALDAAFYLTFGNVQPTGKRLLLALDVSGSMGSGMVAGVPGLTPRVASAAMALITAATEPNHILMAFSNRLVPVVLSPRQRLDDVVKQLSAIPMGGTDCALPMLWAQGYEAKGEGWWAAREGYEKVRNRAVEVDAFVTYTDSETWFGTIHPTQALQQYREATGIPAKLVVAGMVATTFTIADPADGGMLDVVGFDTAAPQLISDFIAG